MTATIAATMPPPIASPPIDVFGRLRKKPSLPKNPAIPWSVKLWKHPLKWLGNLAMVGGLFGLAIHYLRFGPKVVEGADKFPEHEGPRP